MFGHGTEIQVSNILGMDISSHSLYLQVILQTGFVGLTALMALFRHLEYALARAP